MTFGKAFRAKAKEAGFGSLLGLPLEVILFVVAWWLWIGRYFVAAAVVVLGVLAMLALAAWGYQRRVNRMERPPRTGRPVDSLWP
jgi:hypothetical protein